MRRRTLAGWWGGCALVLAAGCSDDVPAGATDVPRATTDAVPDAPTDAGSPMDGGLDAGAPVDVFTPPTIPDATRCGPDAERWPTRGVGACELPAAPAVVHGACTVSVNRPTATLKANQRDGAAHVLITGQRVSEGADRLPLPGYPMSMLRIPGTSFVAVSDGGFALESLRLVDTSGAHLAIPAGGAVPFPSSGGERAPALFYGLAYDPVAHLLYASGGGANRIYAFTVSAAGALTADPTHTIDLGFAETGSEGVDPATHMLRSAFPAGIALSDDGTQLYAALQRGHALGVFSTVTRMLTRVIPLATMATPNTYPYVVARRPGDAGRVYVSLWGASAVAEVDLATAAPVRTFAVGKNPTELSFSPDGARLLVTASDEDAVSEIDLATPAGAVNMRYLGGSATAPRGISPTAIARGPDGRVFVTAKDENAIDVFDGTTYALLGRIATEWQPTDVEVDADGRVLVLTGRSLGKGPNLTPQTTDITDTVVGSIARYDASGASLATGASTVAANNGAMQAFNTVTCPAGAPYDFPVPLPGTGPSTRIRHVVLVVRENKTYDALLGDYPGPDGDAADGDPSLTIVPQPRMATVFPNLRALARRFATLDNYYIPSELSNQGHTWTTAGRGTDFLERTWMLYDGRSTRGSTPLIGTAPIGIPEEGDIFTAMRNANVRAMNWGEIIGTATAAQRAGTRYPGTFFNNDVLDTAKARAFLDTALGSNLWGHNPGGDCDLPPFTYILLPNDHTQGGAQGRPTPISHYQDNDEATGLLIDAISHSTAWPETLVVVIEDDPAQGGDHVDNHRSLALLASPWVRRGGVSHVLYNTSALHRTIELILGVPPHNAVVAAGAPMYDAFTGTPDYTPFDYQPRLECATTNGGGMWADLTAGMDLSQPDNAPGLDRLVWRMLHAGHEPPWAPAADEDGDGD